MLFVGNSADSASDAFLRLCSSNAPTVGFDAFILKTDDPFLRAEDMMLWRRRPHARAAAVESAAAEPPDPAAAAEPPASRARDSLTRAAIAGLLPNDFVKPAKLGMGDKRRAVLPVEFRDKVETHLCVLRRYMEAEGWEKATVDANSGFTKRYHKTSVKASACPWISRSSAMVYGKLSKSKKNGRTKFKARFLHRQELLGFKGYPHGSVNLALLSERSANIVVSAAPPLPMVARALCACLSV